MGLLDSALAEREMARGPRCSVFDVLRSDNTQLVEELQVLLDMPSDRMSHATIARALRAEGIEMGGGTIARHRKGECRCVTT